MKITKNFLLKERIEADGNKIFTSDEILNGNENMLDDYNSLIGYMKYKLTPDELGWLKYIRGKYSIADFIDKNMDKNGVLTIDFEEMSKALDDDNDGAGKATMLPDDTALQKIFFLTYQES